MLHNPASLALGTDSSGVVHTTIFRVYNRRIAADEARARAQVARFGLPRLDPYRFFSFFLWFFCFHA